MTPDHVRMSPDVSTLPLHRLCFFFFNDPATTEIYTLSLHDALPIYPGLEAGRVDLVGRRDVEDVDARREDRKSTRLNSSHPSISYAVFCLKKKKHTASAFLSCDCQSGPHQKRTHRLEAPLHRYSCCP